MVGDVEELWVSPLNVHPSKCGRYRSRTVPNGPLMRSTAKLHHYPLFRTLSSSSAFLFIGNNGAPDE